MSANIFFLYGATVIIWGTTWLAIKFQLGSVDPMVSVFYRFIAASVILMVYCRLADLKMRFHLKDHIFMALQGLVLFSVNYWIIYSATAHLTSGLVAVIFSSIVFMNMVNGALLMGSPIRISVVLGGAIGIVGIAIVFWPEISSFSLSDKAALGVYGMAYGAVIMGIVVVASGKPFNFETTFVYIGSLFYLAVFGTVIAFGCYLKLIGKIGADRAAYATMLFPVVALAISTFFEGYQWSTHNIVGMVLVLIGNGLVINKKALLN
jgi:drug/metabolite transporter (DMT)-like permease